MARKREVLEASEVEARFVWYKAWLDGGDTLTEILARLYVVLDELLPPDSFLKGFAEVWPHYEQQLATSFDKLAAAKAPRVFGKESYWRSMEAERLSFVAQHKEQVLQHWRNGGRDVQDARDHFLNIEGGLLGLSEQVLRHPSASDDELIEITRKEMFRRCAEKGWLKDMTEAQLRATCEDIFRPILVPEARRRGRTSDGGKLLAALDAESAKEGRSPDEHRAAREALLKAIFPNL
jgi:hypothetical protein